MCPLPPRVTRTMTIFPSPRLLRSEEVFRHPGRFRPGRLGRADVVEGALMVTPAQRLHQEAAQAEKAGLRLLQHGVEVLRRRLLVAVELRRDRKSTRLNSSH